jgi:acyl-CoA synthetase (AMP-forming)/AMP-acid ligase II
VLPHVAVTEHYGQSETGALTVRPPEYTTTKRASAGRSLPGLELRVVDADGVDKPPGEIGEVVTRGAHLFLGYLDDAAETAASFPRSDGWLWTGDVGFLDEDGFLTLVDRSKDIIVAGAENIYPAEIEVALRQHAAVADCAVFGIPDERWGEVPAAHVVLASGATTTAENLVAFCCERVARHKRPRLVKFVDALPRSAVGKVQKAILRAPYWEGRAKKI